MASPGNAGTTARVDFGRSLSFVFEDPAWLKKILLGGLMGLLSCLFVGTILTGGYFLHTIRRTARGESLPLPEWDDWGGLFRDGLLAFGVALGHVLALAIPLVAGGGCLIGVAASGAGHDDSRGALAAVATMGFLGLYALFFVCMLLLMVYLPAVMTRLAILGRFGVMLEVRENVGFIRRNLGEYLLSLVIYLVASTVAQFGVILFFVGVFPLAFWAYCVLAYPLGQIAGRDAVLGPAVKTAPPA
jgi:hypothetical protein